MKPCGVKKKRKEEHKQGVERGRESASANSSTKVKEITKTVVNVLAQTLHKKKKKGIICAATA